MLRERGRGGVLLREPAAALGAPQQTCGWAAPLTERPWVLEAWALALASLARLPLPSPSAAPGCRLPALLSHSLSDIVPHMILQGN